MILKRFIFTRLPSFLYITTPRDDITNKQRDLTTSFPLNKQNLPTLSLLESEFLLEKERVETSQFSFSTKLKGKQNERESRKMREQNDKTRQIVKVSQQQ